MTSSRLGQQLSLDFTATTAATPQAEKPLAPATFFGRVPQPVIPLWSNSVVHSPKAEAVAPRIERPPEPKPPPEIPAATTPVAEPEPPRNQHNYRITDADRVGSGSLKAKCLANLDALELLKRIEADDRRPTPAEKRTLVRYVGWGGLPQVFDSWNEEWKPRSGNGWSNCSRQRNWNPPAPPPSTPITPRRASSAPCMTRCGGSDSAQGRVLEPALGLGHFIGLMPDEMHAAFPHHRHRN